MQTIYYWLKGNHLNKSCIKCPLFTLALVILSCGLGWEDQPRASSQPRTPGSLFSCWKSLHYACFLCNSDAEWARSMAANAQKCVTSGLQMSVKEAEKVFFNRLFEQAMPRNVGCYIFKPRVRLSWPGILLHELWRDLNVQTSQSSTTRSFLLKKQEERECCSC